MFLKKLFLLALLAFWPSLGLAQIKPKIMILFDTSKSMMTTDGDGSALCNYKGQDSKIYQLKNAFMLVMQGIGAREMDFALSTFPMFTDPKRQPYCTIDPYCFHEPPNSCSGHYYVENTQDSEFQPGFWDRNACKVSTHTPFTQVTATCGTTACPWYDGYKNEVLKVPFSGTTPEKVMIYFDQKEDTGPAAGSVLANPEVRSNAATYTPLGKSLFYTYGYLHKEVMLPTGDYRKKCEKVVVAMFTDGEETCNMLTYNPFNPSIPDPFYPINQAALLYNNLNVVTHTVAMDLDPKISIVEEIAKAGHGSYTNVKATTSELKKAFLDIIAQSQPPTEICNGKDDDCDNLVDEDFPLKGQPCNNGKFGVCFRTGTYVCKPDGSGVICNAADATGTPEICDNLDNDCDNEIDEGLVNCHCLKQPEICNGKDDDCDKKIDNDIPSVPCGKNMGVCKSGMTQCINGKLECVGSTTGTVETCNGLDDDCDDVRDGMTEVCYSLDKGCDLKTKTCKGICKLGRKLCSPVEDPPKSNKWKGVWGKCEGEVGPAKEICDGIDNNCDGNIDENAECPGGAQCINGQCTRACGSEEFACPVGQLCKNGWCILDPCDPTECDKKGTGWICVNGSCIDPCAGKTCPGKFEQCVHGACVDTSCYTKGCPTGEKCIQGTCKKDPCSGVTCAKEEFCSNGKCVSACDSLQCGPDEVCKVVGEGDQQNTQCVKDPCLTIRCPNGQVCSEGKCSTDPCAAIKCGLGEVCSQGTCIKDLCEVTRCGPEYECKLGNCIPKNLLGSTELLASGAGGWACNVGTTSSSSSEILFFWVGLVVFLFCRRKKA